MDTAAAVFFCISLVAFEVSIRVLSWLLSFFVYFVSIRGSEFFRVFRVFRG